MDIEKFIEKYDINKIKKLESNDPQFLALQKSRQDISNKKSDLFLFLVLQCALISYQIS
jgi:N-glycosylase/DNA lyase